ncbi:MAG: SAM-dependent methyltransferase, partial [Blastocatellia bacterium]
LALKRDSVSYNILAWVYGLMAAKPNVRRVARRAMYLQLSKNGAFEESELWMAAALPSHTLDSVLQRWKPRSFLDAGCGIGRTVQYVAGKQVECLGLEGSKVAIDSSPVKNLIQLVNLNHPVDLGRNVDLVWSYEVAEHIHPKYTDVFLETLSRHGDLIVMSAAQPGQGGAGHFNEQLPAYWIDRMKRKGFDYQQEISAHIHTLPDEFSRNIMVFCRSAAQLRRLFAQVTDSTIATGE